MATFAVVPAAAGPAAAAPQACAADRPDEASALAEASACGGEVGIAGQMNEYDQGWAQPNGQVRWEHHYRPVRIERNRAWIPVDTTLALQPDGSVKPAATAVDLTFSGGGTGSLVQVTEDGDTLKLGSPLGALPRPILDGDTATYPDVLPGVDMQLRADVEGYAQVLVVKNRTAALNPKLATLDFSLAGQGLTLSTDTGGNLRAMDSNGKIKLAGNAPEMWDASAQKATKTRLPLEEGSFGQLKKMKLALGKNKISVSPDESMLTDPNTVYPVYIDPGVTAFKDAWTKVNSKNPTTSYLNSTGTAQVGGTNISNNKYRSFFDLDVASTPIAGKYIVSANFKITQGYSLYCESHPVELWATGYAGAATTWNNQPAWNTKQGSVTSLAGCDSSHPAATLSFDVTANTQTAADRAWTQMTYGLRAPSADETGLRSYKEFGNNPYATITYAASAESDFGVVAGDAFTVGVELSGDEVKSKLVQIGYASSTADQALDSSTASMTAAGETLGTPSDASIDPSDDSLYNEMWSAMTGGGTPPPVTPDEPANVTATGGYSALTEAEGSEDPTYSASGIPRTGTYGIYSAWRDYAARLGLIRNGYYNPSTDKGFGVEKLERKHNLPPNVAKSVMKRPYIAYYVSGKKWRFISYDLHHIKCYWSGIVRRCKSVEKTSILVDHDFRQTPNDGYPFGVVTAYCMTYVGKCPNWVRKTIN